MIFSVWRPDGGYDYFESPQRHGLGDDLPDIKMPSSVNGLGVPAQDIGRPVPRDAVAKGSGTEPKGVMAPMSRPMIGIGSLDFSKENVSGYVVLGAIAGLLGYLLGKRK